ncbi:MAG: putative glycoside hydrolase [Oscillospiraceae bacterium]|nr:putative glycoside hydrolase [Oscillospiraceae bacterium]
MKHRKKGRKLFTYQAKNRRIFSEYHPVRNAVGTLLMLVIMAGLGIVGYNIVGPVVTRIRTEESNPTLTPEPYFTETQPVQTELIAEAVTTTAEVTTTVVQTTTAVTTRRSAKFPEDTVVAYYTSADVLTDLDMLENAAKKCADSGYTAMILPMKDDIGILHYATASERAKQCGAANDNLLTLREIRNAVSRYQINCIAEFYTLTDRTYPNTFNDGSYVFLDGNTRWLDNAPEEGGKPWLNPFSQGTWDYLAGLANELTAGGISQIICKGTVFPHFYPTDSDLLGGQINDPGERKTALLNTLNTIAAAAPGAGLYVDGKALTNGLEEAFDIDQLSMGTVFVEIDPSAFTEPFTAVGERYDPGTLAFREKMLMLTDAMQKAVGGRVMIPCLREDTMTPQELHIAIEALAEAGCRTIHIYPAEEPADENAADAALNDGVQQEAA